MGQIEYKTESSALSKGVRLTIPWDSNAANKLDSPLNKLPLGNTDRTSETAHSSSGSQAITCTLWLLFTKWYRYEPKELIQL